MAVNSGWGKESQHYLEFCGELVISHPPVYQFELGSDGFSRNDAFGMIHPGDTVGWLEQQVVFSFEKKEFLIYGVW